MNTQEAIASLECIDEDLRALIERVNSKAEADTLGDFRKFAVLPAMEALPVLRKMVELLPMIDNALCDDDGMSVDVSLARSLVRAALSGEGEAKKVDPLDDGEWTMVEVDPSDPFAEEGEAK